MSFDSTNYKAFLQNIFMKDRTGNSFTNVYFKQVGKLYRINYGTYPLFVKNLEVGGSNQATPIPQMVGNFGRKITTPDGFVPDSSRSNQRIGPEVASVKFPLRTITLSGIATISDSQADEDPWAWLNLLQDSIDYALKQFQDPAYDAQAQYGPNVQSITLDLANEGLNWSITWQADGNSWKNFFKRDISSNFMDGYWPENVPISYHDRYRIIKWYDMLIRINGTLFDFPGDLTEKEFYATKASLKWQIYAKKFFDFGTNTFDPNNNIYNQIKPIYAPVKMTQDFTLNGISPVSLAQNDFESTSQTGTGLFMHNKTSFSEPFYLRFGYKSNIDYADEYISFVNDTGLTAFPMLKDAKYIQAPESPTQIELSGIMVYS